MSSAPGIAVASWSERPDFPDPVGPQITTSGGSMAFTLSHPALERLPVYQPAPLTTSVVGSHARPGWLDAASDAARRGELGPADIAEVLDDAVDTALRDQSEAGIELVTDGEMRRSGFFTDEFYQRISGVEPVEPERRLGVGGHDQQHRFRVLEPIGAPAGLGVVGEFQAARTRTTLPLKVTLPGPYTLSGRLDSGAGAVYRDRLAAAEACVPLLAAEVAAPPDAGAAVIQIDE